MSFENDSLDFEVDLTDLETFGETTPVTKPKKQELQDSTKTTTQPTVSETVGTKTEQSNPAFDQESEQASSGDSDEEKLIIDDSVSQTLTPNKQPPHRTKSLTPESEPTPDTSGSSSSPQKSTRHGRRSRKLNESGDQLSEILRMQTAMFNPAKNTAKSSTTCQETNPPNQSPGPSVQPPAVSLVKPCVTSYLERTESGNSQESTPVVNILTEPKSQSPFELKFEEQHDICGLINLFVSELLSQDLQAGAEDEQDYEAPEEGNLIYKLYSLHDLLLMVRSSVALSHSRNVGSNENKVQPTLLIQNCTDPAAG